MNINTITPLSYFDIFDHPLRLEELKELCLNKSLNEQELERLIDSGMCFKYNEYISISANIENQVKSRLEKEERAKKYLKKLPLYAKLISKFPFVLGLGISGSLSKNVMQDDGDIDYFVITKKNRLWICRTLLILFKKVFLLNSKKYFCVNYFVDEDNLEIRDKNIFTAIELTYLLPVFNAQIFEKLNRNNTWVSSYFEPIIHPINFKPIERKSYKNHWIESVLGEKLSNKLDLFFMDITIKRWKKKFSHFNADKMELTMRSNRGVSKHHPSDFQNKVLNEYAVRMKELNVQ